MPNLTKQAAQAWGEYQAKPSTENRNKAKAALNAWGDAIDRAMGASNQ